MTLYRRFCILLLAIYLVSGFSEARAAPTYTLVLETWPTTGHGLPGSDAIERIRIPGFADKESCVKFAKDTRAANPPKDNLKTLTRRLMDCWCEAAP